MENLDLKKKLIKAREEHGLLQQQFQQAEPEFIDSIIFKIVSKEKEIEALKNEFINTNYQKLIPVFV